MPHGQICKGRKGGTMSSIPIELKPEEFARLQSIAERLGVSIESLARSSLEDLLSGPGDKFEQVGKDRRHTTGNRE
jgi:hypothetical protein